MDTLIILLILACGTQVFVEAKAIEYNQTYQMHTDNPKCQPTSLSHPWTAVGDTWYTVIMNAGTWFEMDEQCRKVERGRTSLATIRSVEENKHLAEKYAPNNEVLIGGLLIGNKWLWRTPSGGFESISTLFWRSDEPDNVGGNENCINIYRDSATWNDLECKEKRPAFCELRC